MSYPGYPNNKPSTGTGSSYGARNYGHRSSGRHNKSHNTSDTSASSAGAAKTAKDLSLHNGVRPGMQRSSGGRHSGRRSSGRKRPPQHHPHYHNQGMSFETGSTGRVRTASNAPTSNKTHSSDISSNASILPASTVHSNGTSHSFNSSASQSGAPPPTRPQKKGLFNMTGRGLGATIAVIAGVILGATGLMMLVMGFSGGTAMLVMGPALIVAGGVSIGIGAGVCICCKKKKEKEEEEPAKMPSFDDLESSQGSIRPPPAGQQPNNNMAGFSNVNMGYHHDGAEDSIDTAPTTVPSVAAQVPFSQYNVYGQPSTMGTQPRTLVQPGGAVPVSGIMRVQGVQGVQGVAPQMVQPVFASPVQAAAPAPVSAAPAPMPIQGVTYANPMPVAAIPNLQVGGGDHHNGSVDSTTKKVEPQQAKPVKQSRPKLLPPEAAEAPKSTKPTVKLPVPMRAPVVNLNPMPVPKQRGRQRSSSPGAGGGIVPASPNSPLTPKSSYSDNSEFSNSSSADESGNRVNSSLETDTSAATDNGSGMPRKQRVKKRVSFSDDDKKAKRAKRKLRNKSADTKKNSENLRNSLDKEPKSILASKSGAEDYKYIGPPTAVRENTKLNRGRSESPHRNSQRNSRRARSQSPHHQRNPHQQPQQQQQQPPRQHPDPNALHNGPRAAHPAAPAARPRPPLNPADPAVQSRLRRNSRKRSKDTGSQEPQLSPPHQQHPPQGGFANQGFVNEAMEMDLSPTHLSPGEQPVASSSPNSSGTTTNNNFVKPAEGVHHWTPIQQSTPPGTPRPAVLQLANHSHSSTETEI